MCDYQACENVFAKYFEPGCCRAGRAILEWYRGVRGLLVPEDDTRRKPKKIKSCQFSVSGSHSAARGIEVSKRSGFGLYYCGIKVQCLVSCSFNARSEASARGSNFNLNDARLSSHLSTAPFPHRMINSMDSTSTARLLLAQASSCTFSNLDFVDLVRTSSPATSSPAFGKSPPSAPWPYQVVHNCVDPYDAIKIMLRALDANTASVQKSLSTFGRYRMFFPNPTKLASAEADGDAGIHTYS